MLTAATAGALGLLGAVLGTFAGYVGVIGWLRDNSVDGGISALGNVPVANLLVILLGLPLLAAAAGWLLAGRQPPAMLPPTHRVNQTSGQAQLMIDAINQPDTFCRLANLASPRRQSP